MALDFLNEHEPMVRSRLREKSYPSSSMAFSALLDFAVIYLTYPSSVSIFSTFISICNE